MRVSESSKAVIRKIEAVTGTEFDAAAVSYKGGRACAIENVNAKLGAAVKAALGADGLRFMRGHTAKYFITTVQHAGEMGTIVSIQTSGSGRFARTIIEVVGTEVAS